MRVKVTQQIAARHYALTSEVRGTVVEYQQKRTGSWYAHSKDDKLWLDRLALRKDDGELTTLNLDSSSRIETLGEVRLPRRPCTSAAPEPILILHAHSIPHLLHPMDAAIFGLIVADLIAEPMDLRRPPAAGRPGPTNSIPLTTGGNVCNTGVAMAKLGMKVAAAGLGGQRRAGHGRHRTAASCGRRHLGGLRSTRGPDQRHASSPSSRAANAASSTRPA